MTKLLKLTDPTGCFLDIDTGFNLVRGEVKEHPGRLGPTTAEWLRGGGIQYVTAEVRADVELHTTSAVMTEPVSVKNIDTNSPLQNTPMSAIPSADELRAMPISDLRKILADVTGKPSISRKRRDVLNMLEALR